ncbi:MAG: helix-turn-helix domain-containing protein [Ktedonobacteraceae bacterium]|nr:helix-turn-helix domain-containing protein [Ktedonobacteraceae bacterium]
MINKLPSERYYTPQQVQDKLGITESALRNLVRTEQLHRIIPPGKKHGVFLREEVETFLSKWLAFVSINNIEGTEFRAATKEDIEDVQLFARHVFGEQTHSIETRFEWYNAYPKMTYILKDKDRLVAYMEILPIKHEVISDFMNGKIRGWQIAAKDFEKVKPGNEVEFIVMAMATTPDEPTGIRREYSADLLRGVMKELTKLGEEGIHITRVYATSATPTGIGILMHSGFIETGVRIGKRIAFCLNIDTTDLPFFQSYKEAYHTWKSKNEQARRARSTTSE